MLQIANDLIMMKYFKRGNPINLPISLVVQTCMVAWIGFFATGCANTAFPEGGPRDEAPPVVTRSTPPDGAKNFVGDEVRVEFNELIQLRDAFQKFMISPPVNNMPDIIPRGREVIVRFNEELQPNTTYTLDFADAIADNNEGNVLHGFAISFSTGEVVDSLEISGFLFDAQTLAPVANALVMAHKNHADSAFQTLVPLRVTKSNPDGRFSIRNLAPGEYRIFALEDANRNFRYDQPGERIAWHSALITPYIGYHERVDSISSDSVIVVREQAFLPDSVNLFIFQEDNIAQYLVGDNRPSRHQVNYVFSRPLLEPLHVELLGDNRSDWFLYEANARHDSVTIWLTDSAMMKSDSIMTRVTYHVYDSIQGLVLASDTINSYFFETVSEETPRQRRRGAGANEEAVPSLTIEGLKSSLGIIEPLSFNFPTPVKRINRPGIRLYEEIDSVFIPVDAVLTRDSLRIRRFEMSFNRVPEVRYRLVLDSAAFTDINGLSTLPTTQEFTIQAENSYGIFYFDIAKPQPTWLIQLLGRQENVIRQSAVPASGKIAFRFLTPGDYFI